MVRPASNVSVSLLAEKLFEMWLSAGNAPAAATVPSESSCMLVAVGNPLKSFSVPVKSCVKDGAAWLSQARRDFESVCAWTGEERLRLVAATVSGTAYQRTFLISGDSIRANCAYLDAYKTPVPRGRSSAAFGMVRG